VPFFFSLYPRAWRTINSLSKFCYRRREPSCSICAIESFGQANINKCQIYIDALWRCYPSLLQSHCCNNESQWGVVFWGWSLRKESDGELEQSLGTIVSITLELRGYTFSFCMQIPLTLNIVDSLVFIVATIITRKVFTSVWRSLCQQITSVI
jgi:hypothetical protein